VHTRFARHLVTAAVAALLAIPTLPAGVAADPLPQLVITASSGTMVYGGSAPTINASYSGFVGTDSPASLTSAPVCSTTADSASPVATYASSCSGAVDPDYDISYLPGSVDVTQAALLITASSDAMTYGGPVPVITPIYSGLVNGDLAPATLPTCSTTATSSSAAGTYDATCSGAADPNYTISYVKGTITVGASLLITASSGTMTYGGPVPTITPSYSGFVNGDTAASLTTRPSCSTSATNSSPAGPYISSCTGAVDPNYAITYANGNVNVTEVPLSITASSGTMTYGGPVSAITPSYAGFVNGETSSVLTTQPTCSTTATSSSPIGTYPTTCSGAADANYNIVYTGGVLTVAPPFTFPTLTVTPDPKTRPFGTANPAFTYVISDFINGQTLTTARVSGTPSCTTTATLFSAAGTYPITCTVGTLTSPFYSFTFVQGTLTITHGASSVTLSTTTTVFETGTPVTWTAAVEPGVSGATPAGSLAVTIDGVARPAVQLDASGRGSVSVTWLTTGIKRVSVSYAGDASFAPSGTASAAPKVVANTARATGLGVTETTFYPLVDGWRDTVTARGTRLEPLSVSISVKNASGSVVRTFTVRTAFGPYAWAWNGRTSSGTVLPAGVYAITQTLADPYGSHPRAVKTSKVTLSLRKITWSTVTVTARPGPRCFQFTSGDGVGAYTCGSTKALSLTGSAGHWPGVGYQFTLPTGIGYRSIRVEVLGTFSGGRPTVGLHVWSLGTTWGQLYRPGWRRTTISPTAKAWSGVTFTRPGAYVSGRSVRVYVDGGGRLGGAFTFSITGIRLIVSVGTLQ
jgi:hypothetical protein